MPTTSEVTKRVTVHGHVQGVFYRNWAVETAQELGLRGWVKNVDDGTVEALLCGDGPVVEEMLRRMHEGSLRADVARVEARDVDGDVRRGFRKAALTRLAGALLQMRWRVPRLRSG